MLCLYSLKSVGFALYLFRIRVDIDKHAEIVVLSVYTRSIFFYKNRKSKICTKLIICKYFCFFCFSELINWFKWISSLSSVQDAKYFRPAPASMLSPFWSSQSKLMLLAVRGVKCNCFLFFCSQSNLLGTIGMWTPRGLVYNNTQINCCLSEEMSRVEYGVPHKGSAVVSRFWLY